MLTSISPVQRHSKTCHILNLTQLIMKLLRQSALVVFLNQTNEELCLRTQSPQLREGIWVVGKEPPLSIPAGGSGLWQSESGGAGSGTSGSVTYHISGSSPEQLVIVSWKISFLGRNSHQGMFPQEEFELEVQGGWGTIVFIFRSADR
ncbi:hypothetical protein GQ44DRAFT_95441 [Phaeosphaeriaceae sp. PMI808]|nr:hypothetical protein GQ44DRAFT_95441 [Phaeosphaeriaceae sp. PMI808]